ncbi:MAG: hypothetical protein JOY82_14325 [Streptosporangiaceae bacterium]|nr:hypothetical protein [Streptosporangiaceae bacterium]
MEYFYGHLFAAEPEIRAIFPAAMDVQRQRFCRALIKIARGAGEAAGGPWALADRAIAP